MTYQVKWVSSKGRYSSVSFKTLEAAEDCKKRHEEYTGRPAWIVKVRPPRTRCVPLERNPFYGNVQWSRTAPVA